MTYEEFRERYKYDEASDKIGEGGFGVVYKARDTYDTIGERWVAIKAPKPGYEHNEDVGIIKEAQIVLLQPDSQYIARYFEFHDFKKEGRGEYAVMQYYKEGNFRKILDKVSQSEKEEILEQILDGIDFLHSLKLEPDNRFIIHKDLKPENILIEKQKEKYIPKISDFGISKLAKRKYLNYVATNDGLFNRVYAAPEQASSLTIHKNVDLYSFGLIACEVFTGQHPNINPEARNSDLIPERWKQLINKCTVYNPEDRVKSVAECREILKQSEESQPPSEPIPINTTKNKIIENKGVKDTSKQQKRIIIFGSLAAIIIIALLLLWLLPKLNSSKQQQSSVVVVAPDTTIVSKDSSALQEKPVEPVGNTETKHDQSNSDNLSSNGSNSNSNSYKSSNGNVLSKNPKQPSPITAKTETGNGNANKTIAQAKVNIVQGAVYINYTNDAFTKEADVIYKSIRQTLSENGIDIADNLATANYELTLTVSTPLRTDGSGENGIVTYYVNLEINLKNRMTNNNVAYSNIDGKENGIYAEKSQIARSFNEPIFKEEIMKKVIPILKK